MSLEYGNCPFCELSCEVHVYPRGGDYSLYACPECGGFGLSHDANESIRNIELAKEQLGMLVTERNLAGLPRIVISNEFTGEKSGVLWITYEEILSSFPKPDQIVNRVMINLSRKVKYIADVIEVNVDSKYTYFAIDQEGVFYMLRQLYEMGLTNHLSIIPGNLRINAKGWERISQINSGTVSIGKQAFVAMWFHESMQEYYEHGIKPAIEADGMTKCIRVDALEHNNKICDAIIKEIKNSRYIVADFTGNRGGVYFEAGYAFGLTIPVIYTVHKRDIENVHFDTRQYNHIIYESSEELYKKLRNRIAATIVF